MNITRSVRLFAAALLAAWTVAAEPEDGMSYFKDKDLSFERSTPPAGTESQPEGPQTVVEDDAGVEVLPAAPALEEGALAPAPVVTPPPRSVLPQAKQAPEEDAESFVVNPAPLPHSRHTPPPPLVAKPLGNGGVAAADGKLEVLSVRELSATEASAMKSWLRCTEPLAAEVRPTGRLRAAMAHVMRVEEGNVPETVVWIFGRSGSCFPRSPGALADEFELLDNAARRAAPPRRGGK
jgi:hypothetical protein